MCGAFQCSANEKLEDKSVRPADATERFVSSLFLSSFTQYKFKLLQLFTSQPSLYIDTTLIKRGLVCNNTIRWQTAYKKGLANIRIIERLRFYIYVYYMKNSPFRTKNFNNFKLLAIVNNVVYSRT